MPILALSIEHPGKPLNPVRNAMQESPITSDSQLIAASPNRDADRKFAITVPCYNSEATIAETLQGIMDQGDALRRVLCVVIADDASPDRTVGVARDAWQVNGLPLTFQARSRNLGEMVNVNTTVADLPKRAEWFLHMHGDNIPKPGWLLLITNQCLAAAANVGIVCASYDTFYDDGRAETGEERTGNAPVVIKGGLASVRDTIRRGCWWHNSCCAIRVSTFREVGGFPPGMRQKGDWDFLLRVLNAGWDIEYLPRALMRYRLHEASASGFAFKTHLDIEESLQVVQKYARSLTWCDLIFVHRQYSHFLMRRFGASILRGDAQRSRKALRMLVRVAASWVSCVAVK